MTAIFIETSALLRVLFQEPGFHETQREISSADRLISSRLLRVEAERSVTRLALSHSQGEALAVDLETRLKMIWPKFDFIEITKAICDAAGTIAPRSHLRTLDAIHVASFLWAKAKHPDIKLLSCDERVLSAVAS